MPTVPAIPKPESPLPVVPVTPQPAPRGPTSRLCLIEFLFQGFPFPAGPGCLPGPAPPSGGGGCLLPSLSFARGDPLPLLLPPPPKTGAAGKNPGWWRAGDGEVPQAGPSTPPCTHTDSQRGTQPTAFREHPSPGRPSGPHLMLFLSPAPREWLGASVVDSGQWASSDCHQLWGPGLPAAPFYAVWPQPGGTSSLLEMLLWAWGGLSASEFFSALGCFPTGARTEPPGTTPASREAEGLTLSGGVKEPREGKGPAWGCTADRTRR